MPTVFDLTLATAECLLLPRYSTTTGLALNLTTLADTGLGEPDNYFDGGTVWFLTGEYAGQSRVITTQAAGLITITPALTGNPIPAGVEYAALDGRYPKDQLIGALNVALREIGPFTQKNETLLIVDDQVRYTLPAGVSDVKRVQFATQDTEPYNWTAPHHWWQEHGTELILDDFHLPPPTLTGNKIRLWYEAPHARVSADATQVTKDVEAQRIAWHAAWVAARNRNARPETSDNTTKAAEEQAMRQALALQAKHPVRRIEKDQQWPNFA